MSYLYLFLALILPWVTGVVWLRYFESFFARVAAENTARTVGYGFFIGYAGLSFIVQLSSIIAGTVSFPVVILTLTLITVAGTLLLRSRKQSMPVVQAEASRQPLSRTFGLAGYASLLMMILILLHLSFSLLEILVRPVYPWDAWLMWIYRAKAWFYMGGVFDFQSTSEWLAAAEPAYTSNALNYPLFASVIPLWAAISLGQWSETLINLPVIFCGVAIILALYGQCRQSGMSVLMALALCYLLVSTPFFGTHLALAGYADIWMCGFVGLGFVALIQGGITNSRKQSAIGLALIALSVLVKNEGVVWLMGAIVFLLILYAPRKPLLILSAAVIGLIVLALSFGVEPISIPWLGQLSVEGNQVTLPLVGSFTLQVFNVWKAYLVSFFLSGSWNLTWLVLAACLIVFATAARVRTHYVAATFILIFLAMQVLIFVFSSHGEFALRYTAINRLPLHFLPAILFAAAVMLQYPLKASGTRIAEPPPGARHAG